MPTQEIRRDEWSKFFDTFSRQHEGWLATLEVFAPDVGAQEEARELPLEGISRGAGEGESETITISLGRNAEDHVSHTIAEPRRVWLEQTNEGVNAALEIESKDDSKALLQLRAPVPTELVDGVVLDR
jgi:hypothetical protein